MADYTELQDDDIQGLLASFGIARATGWKALDGGRANSSFLAETDQGRFILTVCDEKTLEETERAMELLRLLESYELPTPRVVDGVQTFAGRPVVLKRYVEGRVEKLSLSQLRKVGETLARLHAVPVPSGLPGEFSYGVQFFDRVVQWPGSGEFGRWLSRIRDKVKALPWDNLPRGLIHGDLFWDNIVVDGDDVTLLDFEEACHYPLVFDLGMTIVGTCYLSGADCTRRVKALLEGYRPLTEVERKVLFDFAVYAAAATACWRFWQYNFHLPGTDQSHSYKEMVEAAESLEGRVF